VQARPGALAAALVTGALGAGTVLAGLPGPTLASASAAAAAAASSASPSATTTKPTRTSGAPTWTSYFYPLTVGWTCQEALTTVTSGSETLTVAAVTKTRKGQAITIDEASSTDVSGTEVPTNAALHYLITTNGQLVSAPSAGQLSGQAYRVVGDTVFPSVRTLLAGGSGLSRVRISSVPSKSDLAQIKPILVPHATSLEMVLVLKQSGTKVAQLQTSAGTYHDVLAVRSTLKSLDVTNVLPRDRRGLDRQIQPTVAKSLTTTVWYAPGYGPVKVIAGGITGVVTSCAAGTAASSTTTTASTPSPRT
jgi:hypothetical protein